MMAKIVETQSGQRTFEFVNVGAALLVAALLGGFL
jgi:hypothetical protein